MITDIYYWLEINREGGISPAYRAVVDNICRPHTYTQPLQHSLTIDIHWPSRLRPCYPTLVQLKVTANKYGSTIMVDIGKSTFISLSQQVWVYNIVFSSKSFIPSWVSANKYGSTSHGSSAFAQVAKSVKSSEPEALAVMVIKSPNVVLLIVSSSGSNDSMVISAEKKRREKIFITFLKLWPVFSKVD